MVSERCGRLASTAKGFRGAVSTLGWPVRGWSSRRACGSAATPTQYGLRWREDAHRPFFHWLTEQLHTNPWTLDWAAVPGHREERSRGRLCPGAPAYGRTGARNRRGVLMRTSALRRYAPPYPRIRMSGNGLGDGLAGRRWHCEPPGRGRSPHGFGAGLACAPRARPLRIAPVHQSLQEGTGQWPAAALVLAARIGSEVRPLRSYLKDGL